MKTALQELIEKIQSLKKLDGVINAIDVITFMAEKQLEKEKEQIIEAYEDGKQNGMDSITNIHMYIIGEKYYNQTYNQNK
jgi:hypothetical protein